MPDPTVVQTHVSAVSRLDSNHEIIVAACQEALVVVEFGAWPTRAWQLPSVHACRRKIAQQYGLGLAPHVSTLRASRWGFGSAGVDEMSCDDLAKNDREWPCLHDVIQYRRQAFQVVLHAIDTHPALDDGPITWVRT